MLLGRNDVIDLVWWMAEELLEWLSDSLMRATALSRSSVMVMVAMKITAVATKKLL